MWRGLSLRTGLADEAGAPRWVVAMPDVFSIRRTTVEAGTEPVVHEVKVSRADLLADLRRPDERAAYAALASKCWCVLQDGIAEPEEVPPMFGVLVATPARLEVRRPSPRKPSNLPLATWMSLAEVGAERSAVEPQAWLVDVHSRPEQGPALAQGAEPRR